MKTLITTTLLLALTCADTNAQQAFDSSSTRASEPLDGDGLWTHTAGNSKRNSTPSALLTPSIGSPTWENTAYTPIPQSGLVVDRHHVYAIAQDVNNATLAVALDRATGAEVWATPIAPPILDSWSSPVIDLEHSRVIIATGATLVALDAASGDEAWSLTLPATVVNASPVVTSDLGNRDRVLISTYSFGFGEPAQLVCINTDPFDAETNPFQPGEVVWSKALNADSSGNSPAYQNGRVYLATASDGTTQRGTVRCYDITGDTEPNAPLWSFTNTINAGFFGGVCIARGHVYASSYSFTGLQTSANTVKLCKASGDLIWSVPTNRTDATPIVLSDGDVIVSSGVATGAFDFLPFFGSLPSVQYIDDLGDSASLRWDSALATHDDQNMNGVWDFGEPFLSVGGWTHQPIALRINAIPHLLVGTLPQTQPGINIDHNTELRLIDLRADPSDPGFVVQHTIGVGNTPAFASGWIYTSGPSGINAYAPPSPLLATRSIIDRYTHGEITRTQLLESLPR